MGRVVIVISDGPNDIGLRKECPAAVVVIERIDQVEWLPGLRSHNAVETPTVFQPLPATAEIWEFVNKGPRQAVSYVEIRVSFITCQIRAVRWLRRVRHVILTVACSVNRVAASVIQRGGQTMPSVNPPTRLQAMVTAV